MVFIRSIKIGGDYTLKGRVVGFFHLIPV
jgi:hypothetical protein